MPSRLYVFLDTNVLIHGLPVEQVDWPKELKVEEVVLVLAITVIHEMDKLKDGADGRFSRGRARDFFNRFAQYENDALGDPGAKVRDRVWMRVLHREPQIRHGFDPLVRDDRIISAMLDFAETEPRVLLVSRDLGIRMKAGASHLKKMPLPEGLELKPEPDEAERELANTKRELDRLRNKLPKVHIHLVQRGGKALDARAPVQLKIPRMSSPAEIAQAVASEREKCWLRINKNRPLTGLAAALAPSRDDIEEYLPSFHRYLLDWESVALARAHRIPIRIKLVNDGTALASVTEVDLSVKTPLQFEAFGDRPSFPQRPQIRKILGGLGPQDSDMREMARLALGNPVRDEREPRIALEKVSYRLTELMHNDERTLRAFVVVVPPSWGDAGFSIGAVLRVAELSSEEEVTLNVRTEVVSVSLDPSTRDDP